MTREEAKKRFEYYFKMTNKENAKLMKIIDEIYNDFESRICKNCKYANWEFNWCDNKDNEFREGAYFKAIHISKDFGCNRFERIENK